jgi:sugar lactone lactonase YvrE
MVQRAEINAELLIDARAEHGEGPTWDARTGTLYWVDMFGHRLHATDAQSGSDRIIELDDMVCAVAPRATGNGLVAVLNKRVVTLDPVAGAVEEIARVEPDLPSNRANDAKCDAQGRLWVGTMAIDQAVGEAGGLYRVAADGRVEQVLDGISIGNGLAWSADAATMYYVDSPTTEVWAFDFDAASGALSNRRTAVAIPDGWGWPDGMAIDSEGMLWVALWGGSRVVRWQPRGVGAAGPATLLQSVTVPAEQASSCSFGGAALDRLFITTSPTGLDAAARKRQPLAGGLFHAAPGVRGTPTDAFGG